MPKKRKPSRSYDNFETKIFTVALQNVSQERHYYQHSTPTQRNRPQFNPMSIMFSFFDFSFIGRPHSYSTLTDNFDVYNIETALPKIDLEAIENHLKAAKEEERRVSCILFFHFILHNSIDCIV